MAEDVGGGGACLSAVTGYRQRLGRHPALPSQNDQFAGKPHKRPGSHSWRWLAAPAVAFVAVVYVAPMLLLLTHSVTDPSFGLQNYIRILTHTSYVRIIVQTLLISAGATLIALIVGYPVAYLIATSGNAHLRLFLLTCVVAPYLTSTLIRTFAWEVILGRVGLINNTLRMLGFGGLDLIFNGFAVIVGLTHFLLPLMILPLVSVMRQIDPALMRAATSLGAGRASAFVRVFVPTSLPGIEVGIVLCFVYGAGAFVIPALLGGNSGQMLGVLIETAVDQQADFGLASAASALLAGAVVIAIWFFRLGMSGGVESLASPTSAAVSVSAVHSHGRFFTWVISGAGAIANLVDRSGISRRRWVVATYGATVGLLILLPQLIVIPISFSSTRALIFPPPSWSLRWYLGFLRPDWMTPFLTSLEIGLVVAFASAVLGTLAAIGVVRGLKPRTAAACSLLLLTPLLFPTVVAAAAFFLLFIRLRLTDNVFGIMLAHTTIAVPFVFAIMAANLRSLDPRYERAAASLGAGLRVQLHRVLLPLLMGGLATSTFFAFLASFDEAVISIFLSGIHVKTLPRRMYEALAFESDPTIAVVAVLMMLLAVIALAGSFLLQRRTGAARAKFSQTTTISP